MRMMMTFVGVVASVLGPCTDGEEDGRLTELAVTAYHAEAANSSCAIVLWCFLAKSWWVRFKSPAPGRLMEVSGSFIGRLKQGGKSYLCVQPERLNVFSVVSASTSAPAPIPSSTPPSPGRRNCIPRRMALPQRLSVTLS